MEVIGSSSGAGVGSIKAPEEEPGYTVGAEEVVSVIGDGVVSATLIGRHCGVGK